MRTPKPTSLAPFQQNKSSMQSQIGRKISLLSTIFKWYVPYLYAHVLSRQLLVNQQGMLRVRRKPSLAASPYMGIFLTSTEPPKFCNRLGMNRDGSSLDPRFSVP